MDDTLFDSEDLIALAEPNPCVKLYGPGPEGATCQACSRLLHYRNQRGTKRWYKCPLREYGRARTDHRLKWKACSQFTTDPLYDF